MKQVRSIAIVAGGVLDATLLPRIRKAALTIGVDRGAWWLLTHKTVPQIAIGDFDSVTKKELSRLKHRVPEVIPYAPEKDATDLELAAKRALAYKPDTVWMYGVLGSRFDHGFAGIQVLQNMTSHKVKVYIVDNFCEISIVVRRVERVEKNPSYKYVSIFPLNGNAVVTLKGFKYNVARRRFRIGSTLGVSNELVGHSGHIEVHEGAVLLVRSRD